MEKIFIFYLLGISFLANAIHVQAQSIRKNYHEMGPMEITDYNDALQQFYNGGSNSSCGTLYTSIPYIADYPIMHYENGSAFAGAATSIHMSLYFLPWHRTFMLDWENRLKSFSGAHPYNYLATPYWDWQDDADPSNTTGITSATYPDFWAYNFIPASNFDGTGAYPLWKFKYTSCVYTPGTYTISYTRPTSFGSPAVINSVASPAIINGILGSSVYYDYGCGGPSPGVSDGVEMTPHNALHGFIGGIMGAFYSPLDPVFWLHHGMVDKVWHDWEESHTSSYGSSDLLSLPFTTCWNGTPGVSFPATLPVYTTEACSTKVDNRYLSFGGTNYDVWYAYKGKVLINGNKNTNFTISSGTKTYRYTVYNAGSGAYDLGEIYVGDVKRSGSAVITDTKGQVIINSGAIAHFRTSGQINFMPGFKADAGSVISAKIINTPNGF